MFYLARMKAVNDGQEYGVKFYTNGAIDIIRDPYGSYEVLSPTNRIEDGITFIDITFNDRLAVFNSFGQLNKNCLPGSNLTGYVMLANDKGDTTQVEIALVTGRIKETNQ